MGNINKLWVIAADKKCMGVVVPDSIPAEAGKLSLITQTVMKHIDFAIKPKQCIQLRLIKPVYHAFPCEIHSKEFVTDKNIVSGCND